MTEKIKINKIIVDQDLYPRVQFGYYTAFGYSQKIKAGVKLPPIAVAKNKKGIIYLIDGLHRIEALKILQETEIEAEILEGLTRKEMLLESIKRNTTHGKMLSSPDRAKAIKLMQEQGIETYEISEIIGIPVGDIQNFVVKRVANSVTGEEIYLKRELRQLAGTEINDKTIESNRYFAGVSAFRLINELIYLLENDLVNMRKQNVKNSFLKLRDLIGKTVIKKRKK